MDQNICESCFLVVWPLCWNCCSCLCTLFWFTNVDSFSYLYFCFFLCLSGFCDDSWKKICWNPVPCPCTEPSPGETQRIGIVLLSSTFLSRIQRFRWQASSILCRLTDADSASKQKENLMFLLHSHLMLVLVLACKWVESCTARVTTVLAPERQAEWAGAGWDLRFWRQQRSYARFRWSCYLTGMAGLYDSFSIL